MLYIGATEARIARHWNASLVVAIRLSCLRHTVSLAFRCERMLGEPSIHLCFSRLRFGLRGSNSHHQGQSLASCQLDEARLS